VTVLSKNRKEFGIARGKRRVRCGDSFIPFDSGNRGLTGRFMSDWTTAGEF